MEVAAVGLDRVVADRREALELRLERREIPRAVELERNAIVRHGLCSLMLEIVTDV